MQLSKTITFAGVEFKVFEKDSYISSRNFRVEVHIGTKIFVRWIPFRYFEDNDAIIIKSLKQCEDSIIISAPNNHIFLPNELY